MTSAASRQLKQTALFLTILAVYLWFTTYGSLEFFKPEGIGQLFDAQALSLLHGHVDVDKKFLEIEYFTRGEKTYTYWGPWPAFLRMPLDLLFPSKFGLWSRLSCFTAGLLSVLGFFLALKIQLRRSAWSGRSKDFFLKAFTLGFALGTPIVWLLSCSIVYHEAILWGLCGSIWCLYFYFRFDPFSASPRLRDGIYFSLCIGATLLARGTYAFPWVMTLGFVILALSHGRSHAPFSRPKYSFALILTPLFLAAVFQGWLNKERFGSPLKFIDLSQHYLFVNQRRFEPIRKFGYSSTLRIPDTFQNYLIPSTRNLFALFPYVRTHIPVVEHPEMFDGVEPTLPLSMSSPWLIVFGMASIGLIVRKRAQLAEHGFLIFLLLQAVGALLLWAVIERYLIEMLPFFCATVLILPRLLREPRSGVKKLAVFLCAISIYCSISAAFTWSVESCGATPQEYRDRMKAWIGEIDVQIRNMLGH